MNNRTRIVLALVPTLCLPLFAQVPFRAGQPDVTPRPGGPRSAAIEPGRTPGRTIRIRPPRTGERPFTTAPLVTPTPPALRVAGPEDPAQVILGYVGGEELNLQEVQDQLARVRSRLFSGPADDVEAYRRKFARMLVNDWVDTKLLALGAHERNITCTPEEIDSYVKGTAQDSGLNVSIQERCQQFGIAPEKFRATIEDAVLGDKLIRQTIRERISDTMLQDAMNKNPAGFWVYPRRHVQHIFYAFSVGDRADQIADMQSKMKAIRRRLSWFGGEFQTYVAKHPAENLFFDDLWLTVGDRIDPKRQFMYELVFRLEPPLPTMPAQYVLKKDEISDVVRSEAGFHVFRVVDEQPPRRKTLQEARADAEFIFYDQVRPALIRELEEKHLVDRDPENLIEMLPLKKLGSFRAQSTPGRPAPSLLSPPPGPRSDNAPTSRGTVRILP